MQKPNLNDIFVQLAILITQDPRDSHTSLKMNIVLVTSFRVTTLSLNRQGSLLDSTRAAVDHYR
jgi:hypothetical protein